jgi:hypothetical protein
MAQEESSEHEIVQRILDAPANVSNGELFKLKPDLFSYTIQGLQNLSSRKPLLKHS